MATMILSDEEAKILFKMQQKFLISYYKNKNTIDIDEWLQNELIKELPDYDIIKIKEICNEIIETTELNAKNYESLKKARNQGFSTEQWFGKKLEESCKAVEINKVAEYLQKIDNALLEANTITFDAITNNNGEISRQINLDGYIAEVEHTTSFNLDAAIKEKNYNAENLYPKDGIYKANSVDIHIKNETGNVVKRYQSKYGKDDKATSEYLNDGDYRGQQKLVPAEQQNKIPNSKSKIEYNGVESKELTKTEAKKLQNDVQEGNCESIKKDWNHFELKKLTKAIGQKAMFSGLTSAGITAGFDIANRIATGEEIEADEVMRNALLAGADTGANVAISGAIKAASEKGLIKIIPQGTPAGVIANVVYVGIENAKVLAKVFSGELTLKEGLDKMGEVTASTTLGVITAGIGWAKGMAIGAVALSWLPIAGPIIGGFIGGTVTYIAGSEIGKGVYNVAKKITNTAVKVTKAIVETGVTVVKKVVNTVSNVARSFCDGVKNVCRSIGSFFGF